MATKKVTKSGPRAPIVNEYGERPRGTHCPEHISRIIDAVLELPHDTPEDLVDRIPELPEFKKIEREGLGHAIIPMKNLPGISLNSHPKFKTPEILAESIKAYFASCYQWKTFIDKVDDGKGGLKEVANERYVQVEPFTMSGLCLGLGAIKRLALIQYERGDNNAAVRDGRFRYLIQAARQIIENVLELKLVSGDQGTAGYTFLLRNNHGYEDKVVQEQTGPNGGPQEHVHLATPDPDKFQEFRERFAERTNRRKPVEGAEEA